MNQNVGNFGDNLNPALGVYRDVTGTSSSSNMSSTLPAQNSSLFQSIPPTSAFTDGPPGHAAISICPRTWWQEREPERAPLREEEQWPNRLFSSSPPLQSVPDFAPESAPQLHQVPNQIDLINLQDTLQLPPPMTVQHRHASGDLTPVNKKLFQATCGVNEIVQAQILSEFIRLQALQDGPNRDLAVQIPENASVQPGYWRCAISGCQQRPQRQWDLAAHFLKHMNCTQKPWECVPTCGKQYARNGDLRRHQRTCREFLSKSDNPIPNPAADASPNGPHYLPPGNSSQPNGSQQRFASSAPSSSTSHYSAMHVVPQFQSHPQIASNVQFSGYQNEWPSFAHSRGVSQGSYPVHNVDENTGNDEKGAFSPNKNVKDSVPIEVRRPVDMPEFERLEKGTISGRGDSGYPSPRTNTHKSIRSTAISLAILFVVVSSMFGWQLYRTLS